MEKEKKKKEKSRPVTSARSFSNRISSYLLASTNGRKKRLITREKERERTTREFPHNSRLCSFEYHSFHSFKRSTLKELFLFFPSLSLSLASFNYMKRDSTRGRCDKRGNNDERRIVLSLSKLEEGGVPLFLLPSPFSRFFLRFFFPAIERASGRTRIHADAALNLKQRKTTRGKNDGIRRRERERERDKGMKSKIFTARYFAENARQ